MLAKYELTLVKLRLVVKQSLLIVSNNKINFSKRLFLSSLHWIYNKMERETRACSDVSEQSEAKSVSVSVCVDNHSLEVSLWVR